jgi:hypothetical protein
MPQIDKLEPIEINELMKLVEKIHELVDAFNELEVRFDFHYHATHFSEHSSSYPRWRHEN